MHEIWHTSFSLTICVKFPKQNDSNFSLNEDAQKGEHLILVKTRNEKVRDKEKKRILTNIVKKYHEFNFVN